MFDKMGMERIETLLLEGDISISRVALDAVLLDAQYAGRSARSFLGGNVTALKELM